MRKHGTGMNTNESHIGIVCIDFINEIVDPKGKLARKGYALFNERHGTLDSVQNFLQGARRKQLPVFHIRIGFSTDYKEHPENSPLLGGAKGAGALQLGSWGTKFHPKASPIEGEVVVIKHRVSAFFSTPLDLLLRKYVIHKLFVCGVATDLAVEAAARDAHDRDYSVTVIADCCVAATDEDHEQSIKTIAKFAKVLSSREALA
jgi:nicotinamidase-related amidase